MIVLTDENGSTLLRFHADYIPAISLTGGIVRAKVKTNLVKRFDSSKPVSNYHYLHNLDTIEYATSNLDAIE